MSVKTCSQCKEDKPINHFYYKKRYDTHIAACKMCTLAGQRKYYLANREAKLEYAKVYQQANWKRHLDAAKAWNERNKGAKRNQHYKYTYGITFEDYELMWKQQNGACAICSTTDPGGRSEVFHVDHCHETGKIRALLCLNCNTGIGRFKDNPDILWEAIHYLETHREVS